MAFGAIAGMATLGATGFSTALSVRSARQHNRAVRQLMEQRLEVARLQHQQLHNRAQVEAQRMRTHTNQVAGRIRVAAGEAGVGMGGSTAQMMQVAEREQDLNLSLLQQNLGHQVQAVQLGHQAEMSQLAGQIQSPLMAAFAGGMQGLGTGLNIGMGIRSMGQLAQTPQPEQQQQFGAPRFP